MLRKCVHGLAAFSILTLAGCNASGSPFSNPFGSSQPRPQTVAVQPTQPVPATSATRPSIQINASPKRVQDTIIARAQRRGTTIVGANNTGVTLEAKLSSSTDVVVQQCGPHQPDRAQRIYLETLPSGSGTIVSEDRFIIDAGGRACQLQLTAADVDNGNRALADLKQQSEAPRTAANRPADPAGGLEPLNPSRPVQPLR